MSNLCYHNIKGLRKGKDFGKAGGDRLERNKNLIEQYPWLCSCIDDENGIPSDYDYRYIGYNRNHEQCAIRIVDKVNN